MRICLPPENVPAYRRYYPDCLLVRDDADVVIAHMDGLWALLTAMEMFTGRGTTTPSPIIVDPDAVPILIGWLRRHRGTLRNISKRIGELLTQEPDPTSSDEIQKRNEELTS